MAARLSGGLCGGKRRGRYFPPGCFDNRLARSFGIRMSWTDERIEKLTKMWEGGSTASQIADELGGVSRNAVIGKAHRLGLKSRPSPVKANDKPEPTPAPAPKVAKPAPEAPRAAQPAPRPA